MRFIHTGKIRINSAIIQKRKGYSLIKQARGAGKEDKSMRKSIMTNAKNEKKSKALMASALLLSFMVSASMLPLHSSAADNTRLLNAVKLDKKTQTEMKKLPSREASKTKKKSGFSIKANAASGKFGGLNWNYNSSTKTLTLSGSGKMPTYEAGIPWDIYVYEITKVVIGNGITNIGYGDFYNMESLKSVTLPESVKTIDDLTFTDCKSLTTVNMPKNLKSIGYGAFYGTALTKVTLPSTVTKVDVDAFPAKNAVTYPKKLVKMEDGSYIVAQKVPVSVKQNYNDAFKILSKVNEQRKKAGVSALKMDKDLLDAAMKRAGELAISFSHERPSGYLCFTMSGKMFGENIAYGNMTPAGVMNCWMNSDMHKANILSDDFETIGIGAVVVDGSCYWVQCFGCETDPSAKVNADNYSNKTVTQSIKIVKGTDDVLPCYYGSGTIKTGSTATPKLCFDNGCDYTRIANKYVKAASSAPKKLKVGKNNKMTALKKGKAKVTVQLKDYPNIKAAKTVKVKVKKLAKTNIKSVKSSKRQIRLSWQKKSGVQGYQVRYSPKNNFKGAKIKKIAGKSHTKATLKNLKKNKKYYVGVRTYKKQNGVMLYSNWSKTKEVKVK